jgi:hypothetical protein
MDRIMNGDEWPALMPPLSIGIFAKIILLPVIVIALPGVFRRSSE